MGEVESDDRESPRGRAGAAAGARVDVLMRIDETFYSVLRHEGDELDEVVDVFFVVDSPVVR